MDLSADDDDAFDDVVDATTPEAPTFTASSFGRTRGIGRSGSSGVDRIRSRSLKRTLFSLPQPTLPDEFPDEEALPGLPVADIRFTSGHPGC
jgi:hypothetical protein